MTFSKNVPRASGGGSPWLWGCPRASGGAPRALLGPLGTHRAHGGRPPSWGPWGPIWAHVMLWEEKPSWHNQRAKRDVGKLMLLVFDCVRQHVA